MSSQQGTSVWIRTQLRFRFFSPFQFLFTQRKRDDITCVNRLRPLASLSRRWSSTVEPSEVQLELLTTQKWRRGWVFADSTPQKTILVDNSILGWKSTELFFVVCTRNVSQRSSVLRGWFGRHLKLWRQPGRGSQSYDCCAGRVKTVSKRSCLSNINALSPSKTFQNAMNTNVKLLHTKEM